MIDLVYDFYTRDFVEVESDSATTKNLCMFTKFNWIKQRNAFFLKEYQDYHFIHGKYTLEWTDTEYRYFKYHSSFEDKKPRGCLYRYYIRIPFTSWYFKIFQRTG